MKIDIFDAWEKLYFVFYMHIYAEKCLTFCMQAAILVDHKMHKVYKNGFILDAIVFFSKKCNFWKTSSPQDVISTHRWYDSNVKKNMAETS